MIANAGVRLERFDAGHNSYLYDDLFNLEVYAVAHGKKLFEQAAINAGWDTLTMGTVPVTRYDLVEEQLGTNTPQVWDVIDLIPHTDNKVHWAIAPRFGVSHPVSDHTKFFFNYGIFYSMQKAAVMYGQYDHDALRIRWQPPRDVQSEPASGQDDDVRGRRGACVPARVSADHSRLRQVQCGSGFEREGRRRRPSTAHTTYLTLRARRDSSASSRIRMAESRFAGVPRRNRFPITTRRPTILSGIASIVRPIHAWLPGKSSLKVVRVGSRNVRPKGTFRQASSSSTRT